MVTIEINGEKYVKADSVSANFGEHVCVIATNGWIFEGYNASDDSKSDVLTGASVVRKWSNGLGIGGLADTDHKDDYTLDKVGDIEIFANAVISVIQLNW